MLDDDVLHPEDERLVAVAIAIADGCPVDWSAESLSITTPALRDEHGDGRSIVDRLQYLERLVRGHEATRSSTDHHARKSAHDTLLTESRRGETSSYAAALSVQWGPLVVIEKIGRGSFGDVYRAWDPRLDREVALKLIPEFTPEAAGAPVVEEGRLLARVRHPNVLTVYGAERIDGRVGVWTELIDGETLAEEVARRGPFLAEEAGRIGVEVCRALQAVHAAGLLHRDVKAQNILRDASGRVVLGDFGTGIQINDERGVSEPQVAGTPLYLAPEVLEHQPATVAADVYSVGVLMFFLTTGTYPVTGTTLRDVRNAHRQHQRVALADVRPDLPKLFIAVVERALAIDPRLRFETAVAFGSALSDAIAPESTLPATTRNGRFGRGLTAAAVIVAFVAVVAAFIYRSPTKPDPQIRENAAVSGRAVVRAVSESDSAPQPASPPGPSSTFQSRDWVLISAFENRTGEEALDGTLEYALERELSNSQYLNVVPRERVEDTLQLMRKPADSKLDRRLAQEVALRDGGVRALVTGRVERIGRHYVLSSQIVNPTDGVVLGTISEDAIRQTDLLSALRRHSMRMRETLGEMVSIVRGSEAALERVTTPSLRALQLYSRALPVLQPNESGSAEQLLLEAVREDPDFASAHIMLARAARFLRRPAEEIRAHAERAIALVERTTDIERYFILANYHQLNAVALSGSIAESEQHARQAASMCEALLRIKPDHFRAAEMLANMSARLKQEAKVTEMMRRTADMRPTSVTLRWRLAQRLFQLGDAERGRVHLRRASSLITPAYKQEHPDSLAQILQLEAADAWWRLDARRVRNIADELAHEADVWASPAGVGALRRSLVGLYVALGRFGDARRIAGSESVSAGLPADGRAEFIGRVWFNAATAGQPGAKEALLAHLTQAYPNLADAPAVPLWVDALALTGKLDELRMMVDRATRDGYVYFPNGGGDGRFRWMVPAAEAKLALAEGRIEDAERHFDVAEAMGGGNRVGSAYLVADAWIARGELQRASEVLERATENQWTFLSVSGGFGVSVGNWIRNRERLADVYRMLGRIKDAAAIEAQLLKLLAAAEDGHAMHLRLTARSRARNAPAVVTRSLVR